MIFFFLKQKTAYELRISDWSSDVCSSDLCRSPSLGGSSVLEVSGSTQLAETIWLSAMITAPSWSGPFLEKMVSRRRLETTAFRDSPLLKKSCPSMFLAKTIRAPVLVFFMLRQASIMGFILSSLTPSTDLFPKLKRLEVHNSELQSLT